MKLSNEQLKKIIHEELEAVLEANRTPSGQPSADARQKYSTLPDKEKTKTKKDDRFPIFDKKSAESAIKLRGHGTTPEQREKIINRAAKFAPQAANKARAADKKEGKQ